MSEQLDGPDDTDSAGAGVAGSVPTMERRDVLAALGGGFAVPTSIHLGAGQVDADAVPWDEEPMTTETRRVDGSNVLYQFGQPVPSFETWRLNEPAREYLDLDGTWRFRFGRDGKDPEEIGRKRGWYEADFDDGDWEEQDVPLPWDLYGTPWFGQEQLDGDPFASSEWSTGTATRDGYGWYRRTFHLDERWTDRIARLTFLGAYYRARIWVNGTEVAVHEGGHCPFSVEVSDELQPGTENVIAVRTYRRPWYTTYAADSDPTMVTDPEEIVPAAVDYWPYAGLTRSVYLEGTDRTAVMKLLTDATEGTLSVEVVLYNYSDVEQSRTLTVDPGRGTGGEPRQRDVTIDPDSASVVELTIDVPDAETWDVDAPTTYEASATLREAGTVTDRLTTTYGMRTLTTDGSALKLNGERVFLKGQNWHEEMPSTGRTMTPDQYDEELGHVLDMNCNLIRNHVYNRHPYVYEWADQHGVLVLDEAPNMWMSATSQRVQLERYGLSRALCEKMVWNQHNRPSTVLWSVQNESAHGDAYREWIGDMKEGITGLDRQNRPVTWATQNQDDPFALADVIGFNEYFGFFYGNSTDLGSALESLHEKHPRKPILITENGIWSNPDERNESHDPTDTGSEQWQATYVQAHLNQVTKPRYRNYLTGYVHWLLKDYKTRQPYNWGAANAVSTMGTLWFSKRDTNRNYERIRRTPNPLSESAPSYSIDAGEGTTLVDATSNGIDGSIAGGSWEQDVAIGDETETVLSFDGEATVTTPADHVSRRGAYSQLFRVLLADTEEDRVLAGDWGADGTHLLYYNSETDCLELALRDTEGTVMEVTETGVTPPVGEWFQVGWSYDGALYFGDSEREYGKLRLYQNGEMTGEAVGTGFAIGETDSRQFGGDFGAHPGWVGKVGSIEEWYHLKSPSFFASTYRNQLAETRRTTDAYSTPQPTATPTSTPSSSGKESGDLSTVTGFIAVTGSVGLAYLFHRYRINSSSDADGES